MTFRSRVVFRVVICFTVLGLAGLMAGLSRAPAQQGGKGQEHLPYDEAAAAYKAKRTEIKQMFEGALAADKKVLDLAAKYYAYRLTDTLLQGKKEQMHKDRKSVV